MHKLMLFIDGSADSKTRMGYGAYFFISDGDLAIHHQQKNVKTKAFENTSSTKLELQTLLWALGETVFLAEKSAQIIIYTDSQNIVGLPARRHDLEQRNYYANNGKKLTNAELYQQFFTLMDQLNYQLIKVAGHKIQADKNTIDQIFAMVDKTARAELRKNVVHVNNNVM